MKILLLIFSLGFIKTGATYAQENCFNAPSPFQIGEKISYNIHYNWGFIWVEAGFVSFEVRPVQLNTFFFNPDEMMHLYANGYTLKKWDWMFKVRDTFESYVTVNDFDIKHFKRNSSEGKYKVKNEYVFENKTKQIRSNTWNSESKLKKETTISYRGCTYDVLSMVYAARKIDFSKYNKNEKIPISLIIDGEVYPDLYIRYLGKEQIKLKGKTYNCIKLIPFLVEGTIFGEGEDMTVWVEDSPSKIPIMIEAKILVGSIKAILTE